MLKKDGLIGASMSEFAIYGSNFGYIRIIITETKTTNNKYL